MILAVIEHTSTSVTATTFLLLLLHVVVAAASRARDCDGGRYVRSNGCTIAVIMIVALRILVLVNVAVMVVVVTVLGSVPAATKFDLRLHRLPVFFTSIALLYLLKS